ncbi:MAG: hypothetical protein LQ344_000214 [Seirophora lacunosa]|nr:MAG: hypothetical protein LQ344_000214 [Seirophora lacunosa]
MRFVDSIAQCNATVTILADGRECPEYSIVGDEHGNLKCYIPLMPDQVISVQVAMDMTSEHFEVDLFTDGVIRNFWQSTRNSVNKHRAPSVEFTQGIYKYMRSLYRSSMTTTSIPENLTAAGHQRTNVGSIVVMINKQDRDRNLHYHGCILPDDVPKHWYEQAIARRPGIAPPSLQMMFKNGSRMQEADRGGTRIRMRRTRQGEAPWATFKFLYRERDQLRAAGIVNQARIGYVSATPLGSLSGSRKRAPTDDGSMSPESSLQRQRQNVEDLRTEVLELQIQADRAKRIRLEKEKETEALARQARQEWAELELAKANLEREVAEEHSRAVVQEEAQARLRRGPSSAMEANEAFD